MYVRLDMRFSVPLKIFIPRNLTLPVCARMFSFSLSFNFVMLRELKQRIFPGGFPPGGVWNLLAIKKCFQNYQWLGCQHDGNHIKCFLPSTFLICGLLTHVRCGWLCICQLMILYRFWIVDSDQSSVTRARETSPQAMFLFHTLNS